MPCAAAKGIIKINGFNCTSVSILLLGAQHFCDATNRPHAEDCNDHIETKGNILHNFSL